MAIFVCTVCDTIYDESRESMKFDELPDTWLCPVCEAPKSLFRQIGDTVDEEKPDLGESSQVVAALARESDKPVRETVSDLMIDTMVNWGVRHVFGMVGHSNLGLAEAVRKRCESGDLTFIGIRHEGAASFAASAYGKLTGRPAACLAIAGPGATNLLTGLWDAKLDRVPILALTGQVDLQFLGPGAFQEVDLSAAFGAVSCWSQTVLNESNHAELMSLALKHAILNRGVAHLIFPNQIQELAVPAEAQPLGPDGRLALSEISPSPRSLEHAVRAIRASSRPVIVVGHGSRFCMDQITRFAERFNVPVITTFKGKGLISDDHPLACGVLGLSGTPVSAGFMAESDLLMVFGASFARHTGIAKEKPTIQVDLDPMVLGKFHPVEIPIWGEIGVTIDALMERLETEGPKADPRPEIAEQWRAWRSEKERRAGEIGRNGLSAASVFSAMNGIVPENAVIAVDVGNNTYSFGRYFECRSQSVLMSGYLGSIGYGYPAAIGAAAAAPDRPIFAVTGDGGFGQYMGELTTAVKYGLPIKHILLNNLQLGKISREQRIEGKVVWSTDLHNPDFSKYAENCGAVGVRVSKLSQLEESLKIIIDHQGPAMLEVMTDPDLT